MRVHDSQAYRKMEMTRERIIRILDSFGLDTFNSKLFSEHHPANVSTSARKDDSSEIRIRPSSVVLLENLCSQDQLQRSRNADLERCSFEMYSQKFCSVTFEELAQSLQRSRLWLSTYGLKRNSVLDKVFKNYGL